MLSQIRLCLFGSAFAFVLLGCSQGVDRAAGKEYDIEGKIVAIAPDGASVTINHEAIPGLMRGMEMSFRVAEAGVLKGLKPDDAVKGRLRVLDGVYTIFSLRSAAETAEAKEIRESLAKLSDTDRPLAESQKLCPMTGRPLGSMGVPTKVSIKGEPVFLCCDGCDDRALADPVKTLAKLKTLREKNKGDQK